MLTTLIAVFSVAFGLFYLQYSTQYQYEISELQDVFEEKLFDIEHVAQTTEEQVQAMKYKAETYLVTHLQPQNSLLFNQLQQVNESSYNLDNVQSPFDETMIGNLTGQGRLDKRDANFYRELDMALDLSPLFTIAQRNVPNATWIYYTSANYFMSFYPWIESTEFSFAEEFYKYEFYTLGLPNNNLSGTIFWTNPYIDAAGKGLMVTCAIPIYENKRFLGTVAINLTLTTLNQMIQDFPYPTENLLLVNDNYQLLAHSKMLSSQAVQSAKIGFPTDMQAQWQTLFQHPEGEIVKIGDYLAIYKKLSNVPWKLILLLPNQLIVKNVIYKTSWGFIILLPCLLVVLLITYLVTHQEFIRPAGYLIEHIENESKVISKLIPKVPTDWHIWFTTVSNIFAQNRDLFAELKEYSASLEEKVQERTRDIIFKNKTLVLLNQEKNEFLGIVAHDLKNPLSAILNLAQMIQEAKGDLSQEELLEYADIIEMSAHNMFQLITNLLDVNAIESGKMNVNLEIIDISSIIKRTIANYAEQAKRKNITIHLKYLGEKTGSYWAFVDINLTQQILDNVVSNAIKYSPQGKNVCVRLTDLEKQVRCEIEDEGPGLSADEQKKLFGKFTRLSPKPTGGEHSTGLGLFIVKKLVDTLAGQVWCQSEVGKGTRFIIEFPKNSINNMS